MTPELKAAEIVSAWPTNNYMDAAVLSADVHWNNWLDAHCQGNACMADKEWPRYDGKERHCYCCQCPMHIGEIRK